MVDVGSGPRVIGVHYQYYDLRPDKKEEYKDFIINEHLLTMEKIDYVEAAGGWNMILGGISEIIAEFTMNSYCYEKPRFLKLFLVETPERAPRNVNDSKNLLISDTF